jgi:aldehyde:ferredoxin oxidoreductase
MKTGGYLDKILRVDLSNGETAVESLDRPFIEKWIGGKEL